MKKFKIVVLTLIILGTIGMFGLFGIDLYVRSKSSDYIMEPTDIEADRTYDYILILGAGIYPDGTPSPMLKERLDTGIKAYEKGLSDKIIVSGDHTKEDYDEVNSMKRYMIQNGVPSNAIYMDHAGISTYDSIYRAKEYFAASSLLIVTQKYHLYRSIYIGECLDLEVRGVNATKKIYSGQTYRDAREFLARVKDFAKCLAKPSSQIGGEAIPVSKGGNITNDKEFILIESKDGDPSKEKYINSNTIIETFTYILDEYFNLPSMILHFDDDVDYLILTMPNDKEYGLIIADEKVYLSKDDESIPLNYEDSKEIIDILNVF